MKNFMMQLQDVYNGLKDKNEIAIMKEYNYIANCYTTAFTSKIKFLHFYIFLDFTFFLYFSLSLLDIKILIGKILMSINIIIFSHIYKCYMYFAYLYVCNTSQEFIKYLLHI